MVMSAERKDARRKFNAEKQSVIAAAGRPPHFSWKLWMRLSTEEPLSQFCRGLGDYD
jgi:hypothetical protein